MRKLSAVLLCFILCGCATGASFELAGELSRCPDKNDTSYIYSGMRYHFSLMRNGYEDTYWMILDIPFSLVADTFILPFSIPSQYSFEKKCEKADQET